MKSVERVLITFIQAKDDRLRVKNKFFEPEEIHLGDKIIAPCLSEGQGQGYGSS
jgi:hypothetical protein